MRPRKALHAVRKSKNGMGWHHGFKFHLIVNRLGEIVNARITAGNVDDRKPVKNCVGE